MSPNKNCDVTTRKMLLREMKDMGLEPWDMKIHQNIENSGKINKSKIIQILGTSRDKVIKVNQKDA